jgi:hypothetical protein
MFQKMMRFGCESFGNILKLQKTKRNRNRQGSVRWKNSFVAIRTDQDEISATSDSTHACPSTDDIKVKEETAIGEKISLVGFLME